MNPQGDETRHPAVDVPAEVPAQLHLNLEMLGAADDYAAALPAERRARSEAMTDEQAHEQYVAFLALLPTATRDRLRRCNAWLSAHVDEISRTPADPDPPARLSPAAAPLRLASSPESEAAG